MPSIICVIPITIVIVVVIIIIIIIVVTITVIIVIIIIIIRYTGYQMENAEKRIFLRTGMKKVALLEVIRKTLKEHILHKNKGY